MSRKPIIIGLAGGSCSGKSSISKILAQKINTNSVTILHEKGYYKNKQQEPNLENTEQNFDHPNAFNNYLLLQNVKELINGRSIREPFYSYHTHTRLHYSKLKEPADVIIVEGILALYDERLRHLMDIKVYVNADSDIMLIRRLRRDVKSDNTNLTNVFKHYIDTVKPMYKQFVLPTQRYADLIIPENWKNGIAINALASRINTLLKERK